MIIQQLKEVEDQKLKLQADVYRTQANAVRMVGVTRTPAEKKFNEKNEAMKKQLEGTVLQLEKEKVGVEKELEYVRADIYMKSLADDDKTSPSPTFPN